MADYVAREWSNGDIVTAANLNNIEQGVAEVASTGSIALIINYNTETQSSDKTFQQVKDAYDAGLPIYLQTNSNSFYSRGILATLSISQQKVGFIMYNDDTGDFNNFALNTETDSGLLIHVSAIA